MTRTADDQTNPFETPTADPKMPDGMDKRAVEHDTIKKFRMEIHALGAALILIGSGCCLVGVSAMMVGPWPLHLGRFLGSEFWGRLGGLGISCIVLGVLTCFKQMWAVYVGLLASWIMLLLQILQFNLSAAIILIVVIVQHHRVIRWANQMHAAGLPLDAKPDDFQ